MSHLTRRTFLKLSAGTLAAVSAASILDLAFLEEVTDIPNPLESYPDRGWEKVYLDQYHYDDSFTFICAPNDTHNCRLRAFVRNGIITRMEQAYDAGEVGDLYGNKLTPDLEPPRLPEGDDLCAAHIRAVPRQGADHPQGLEGVGGRRLPRGRGRAAAAAVLPSRGGCLGAGELGRSERLHRPRPPPHRR